MKQFTITSNDANQRLDKFLKKLLPNAALSLIYKLNRKNSVKVNRKREDNEYKIQEGDSIELFVKDEEYAMLTAVTKSVSQRTDKERLDIKDIVYEDGDLLIVNKNPGTIVHPGDFKTTELSLIAQAQDYLGEKLSSLTFKPSLIHRIDKDTSGIVMIAKTKPSLDVMLGALQSNKIEKVYLAVCLGTPPETRGVIRRKLRRLEHAERENKIVVDDENGQTAVTHYQVLETGIHGKYSLIECTLETGRMHQIRVHLASIGCPVLGDNAYGDKQENAFAKRAYEIGRQLLHASRIGFVHPSKKVPVTYTAKLKKDMAGLLGRNQ
ncbi:MAG: RluA family pseudouridine synthase [Candidatus Gracilibacteria bacterium]|nr:RluA family pseudouridine synthase [Candidatus Gracilibacteria bacterium]